MLKSVKTGVLTLCTTVALAGCLVSQHEVPVYESTTDVLRIYQGNDQITYNVSGEIIHSAGGVTPVTGTLQVQWKAYNFLDHTGQRVDGILQEVSTLTLNGGADETHTTKRYIKQDIDGTINLYGIESISSVQNHKEYYLVPGSSPNDTPGPVTILKSPLVLNDAYDVGTLVMDDCTEFSCTTAIASITSEQLTVSRANEEVRTQSGRFKTYHVDYGGTLSEPFSGENIPVLLDMRAMCYQNSSPVTYSGYLAIFPSVGVVYSSNTCFATTGQYNLRATLVSTNIPLPQ